MVWPVIAVRSRLRHGSLSCDPRLGFTVIVRPAWTIAGFSVSSTKNKHRGTIVAPCRECSEYGESPDIDVSVTFTATRRTFL